MGSTTSLSLSSFKLFVPLALWKNSWCDLGTERKPYYVASNLDKQLALLLIRLLFLSSRSSQPLFVVSLPILFICCANEIFLTLDQRILAETAMKKDRRSVERFK